jgi:hypothetical protein
LTDLAQALGCREDEVAMMLYQIREKKGSVGRRRKVIPVGRSWVFIVAIYAVFCLGAGMYAIGRSSRYVSTYDDQGWRYVNQPDFYPASDYFNRSATNHKLPNEFGFRYRNSYLDGQQNYSRKPLDWDTAELALNDVVLSINAKEPVNLVEDVTDKEIADALAKGKTTGTPKASFDPGQTQRVGVNRLIDWLPLKLEVDGHTISTTLPSAKVANEKVDAAVNLSIKDRLSKLIKAMRTRVAPGDIGPRHDLEVG